MRPSSIAGAIAVVAVAIAGCGGGGAGKQTDAQQIQAVYSSFAKALRDHDGGAACRTTTVQARAGMMVAAAFLGSKPDSCAAAAEAIANEADPADLRNAKLTDIRVHGDRATAHDGADTEQFRRVAGRWLIDNDSESDASPGTTTTSPASDDCDKLGINHEGGREGACITNGVHVSVANPGSAAIVENLTARLTGTRTERSIPQEFGSDIHPEGVFLIADVELVNTGTSPSSYDFGLSLGESRYDVADEAQFALDDKAQADLGPGLKRRVSVVFDVPTAKTAEIKTTGNVLVSATGSDDHAAVLRTYQPG